MINHDYKLIAARNKLGHSWADVCWRHQTRAAIGWKLVSGRGHV